jgi:hypothetical protein
VGVEQPRDFKLLLSKGKLVQSSTNISEHSEPGDRQRHPAKKTYLLDLKKEQERRYELLVKTKEDF